MASIARAETDFDLFLVFGILALVVLLIYKGAAIFSWFGNAINNTINAGVSATESAVGSVTSPAGSTPQQQQAAGTIDIGVIGTTLGLPSVP